MRKSWIRRTLAALLLSIAADSAQAQLSLSLAANPDPALPDEPIAVAMTVSNAGAAAADVSLSFIVPAAFQTFPEATVSEPVTCNGDIFTPGSCAATETFTWNVGPLAAGEGRTLRFTPRVAAAATGIDFAVDLFQGGLPVLEEPPRLEVAVGATRRLELDLAETHDPARPGALLTYVLSYGHPVESAFTEGAALHFQVPDQATFVSASPGCGHAGGVVTCALGRLWEGEGGERRVTIALDAELNDGAIVEAEADLTSTSPAASVRARAVTRIDADSDLVVAIGAGRNAAFRDEALDVEVTASNRGPSTIFDVRLELAVPHGVGGFAEALADSLALGSDPSRVLCNGDIFSPGSCVERETLVWRLGDLGPGQARTLRLPPAVTSDAPSGSLIAFDVWARRAGGGVGPEFAEASRTVLVQEDPDPPFDIAVAEDRDPIAPGEALTYTIQLGHLPNPPSIAEAVLVRFGLPHGATFQSASNGGQLQDGVVQWGPLLLRPGEGRVRTVTVTVAEPAAPDGAGDLLEAWAEIVEDTGDGVRPEGARAQAVTRVRPSAPLELEIRLPDPPTEQGGQFEVEYRVRNVGSQSLLDVDVEGMVPFGVNSFAQSAIVRPPSASDPVCNGDIFSPGSCVPREQFRLTIPELPVGPAVTIRAPFVLLASAATLPDGVVLPFRGVASTADHEAVDVALRAVPEAAAGLAAAAAIATLAVVRRRRGR